MTILVQPGQLTALCFESETDAEETIASIRRTLARGDLVCAFAPAGWTAAQIDECAKRLPGTVAGKLDWTQAGNDAPWVRNEEGAE